MTDTPRITLVTGASAGIGRAAAVALAKAGDHVIITARKAENLEPVDDAITAAGGSATIVPLDLMNGEAIDRLGAALYERWGRLDGLAANAGLLGELAPLGHVTPTIFEETVAVNLTANWRLIRSLDPLLKASEAGRALFVTSGAAIRPRAYWGPYAASKAGLDALALSYAAECAETSVRVNLLNPGATATRMRAKAMPGEDPDTLPQPEDVAPLYVEMTRAGYAENGVRVNYADWAKG
ncbi:MAG: SDR family NAD(P)-dependent oxidoreductase [Pseudomonadota bacterium]